jgi:hypothetical protein
MEENQTKKLFVSLEPKNKENKEKKEKIIKTQKEKQKRQITTTSQWIFTENDLEHENQMNLVKEIQENKIINREPCNFIIRQINNKIYGYRTQDIDKKILCEEKLIGLHNVLQLMIECNNTCFYCKENVNVLYEYVREPKQWTLERLDNNFGHNNDNVVIACLSCNLRRKTMYHERFIFTKQLNIVKKI